MLKYFVHKLGYGLIILWGVVTTIFFLFNLNTQNSALMSMGQRADKSAAEAIQKDMGLDQPLMRRYAKYLNDLSPISVHSLRNPDHFFALDEKIYGDVAYVVKTESWGLVLKKPYLRRSYQSKVKVNRLLAGALPNTFILAAVAILISALVGIFLGIVSALKKDSFLDRALLFVSAFGMSVPSFFAAIIIGWFFAFVLADWTGLNLTGNFIEIDPLGEGEYIAWKNLILPSLTLAIRPVSVFLQLTRNAILDVLGQNYIVTAKSKGLSTRQIILNHVMRNALNPVITAISGWFASLMAGVVFVEYIFGWKGIGYLMVDALNQSDLPVLMGCVMIIGLLFLTINILVDLMYAWLDPRVELS